MDTDLIRRLSIPGETKVVLCVMDGLGGLPGPRGRTELEEADTRHLDRLAEDGALGQTIPVGIGITVVLSSASTSRPLASQGISSC